MIIPSKLSKYFRSLETLWNFSVEKISKSTLCSSLCRHCLIGMISPIFSSKLVAPTRDSIGWTSMCHSIAGWAANWGLPRTIRRRLICANCECKRPWMWMQLRPRVRNSTADHLHFLPSTFDSSSNSNSDLLTFQTTQNGKRNVPFGQIITARWENTSPMLKICTKKYFPFREVVNIPKL